RWVGLYDGKSSRLQVALDLPASVEVFAGGDGDGCAAMHDGEAVDLFRVSGFFDPVGAVLLDLVGPLERVVLGPSAVGVEHEFGVVANGFAEDAYELDVFAHAFGS